MTTLEKIQKDIEYCNERIYNQNVSIKDLEKQIDETQKKSDRINKLNLLIAGVGFALYILGSFIHPIISIIGLLIIPGMAIVYSITTKLENKINEYKEQIKDFEKDNENINETLETLLNKKVINELINQKNTNNSYDRGDYFRERINIKSNNKGCR